jgi:signal transduction histidine kinase
MGYTRKYEGNGVGLALVQKYCELNNAAVEVDTKKHIGSTFRIIFKAQLEKV